MDPREQYTIFLGGTCGNSDWREKLIPFLKQNEFKYFNPVVDDWTPECQAEENRIKDDPNTVNLFVITSDMIGVYSIAEAVDCAHKNPRQTVFKFDPEGFNGAQVKSLMAVENLLSSIGAHVVRPERGIEHVALQMRQVFNALGAGA